MIDHNRPLDPAAAVRRSRLAEFLCVPTLYTADGRLYRVVAVWRGTEADLLRRLGRVGVEVGPPLAYPGLEGTARSAEGVLFYPVGAVVLCGPYEDVLETVEDPRKLGVCLAASAGRGQPGLARNSPPRGLPPPCGPPGSGLTSGSLPRAQTDPNPPGADP